MFLHRHFEEETEDEAPHGEDLDAIDADIRRNLERILGTKRGCGFAPLPSFGMSDVGFRTPEEAVELRTKELEENIRLYEPRVELLKIDEIYDDDGQRVSLRVQLRRRAADSRIHIVVDLAKGTFDVRPVGDD